MESSLKNRLTREDPHFRALSEKHVRYEARLDELRSRRWLSDGEKAEEVKLKKLKLAIKDEMEAIVRQSG